MNCSRCGNFIGQHAHPCTCGPVWKPIGEASDNMETCMYIERVDGVRIPVQRGGYMPMQRNILGRVQRRDILPVALQPVLAHPRLHNKPSRVDTLREEFQQAVLKCDYARAADLRKQLARAEDDEKERNIVRTLLNWE